MNNEELELLYLKLKSGDYDGVDIMKAWIAIEELIKLRNFHDKALEIYPLLEIDVERSD